MVDFVEVTRDQQLACCRRRIAEHRRLRMIGAPGATLARQLDFASAGRHHIRKPDVDWRFWPFRVKGAPRS